MGVQQYYAVPRVDPTSHDLYYRAKYASSVIRVLLYNHVVLLCVTAKKKGPFGRDSGSNVHTT